MVGCQRLNLHAETLAPRTFLSGASGPLHAFKVFSDLLGQSGVTPLRALGYMGDSESLAAGPMGDANGEALPRVKYPASGPQRMGGDYWRIPQITGGMFRARG